MTIANRYHSVSAGMRVERPDTVDLANQRKNTKSGNHTLGEDPVATLKSSLRVLRGGSWYVSGAECRSAYRSSHEPEKWGNILGFHVALEWAN